MIDRYKKTLSLFLILPVLFFAPSVSAEDRTGELVGMLKLIKNSGVDQKKVLRAFRKIPRHKFVAPKYYSIAYQNKNFYDKAGGITPEPVQLAQEIVAYELNSGSKVLLLGAGSGYQAAVISKIVSDLHVVEENRERAKTAENRLDSLEILNVSVHSGSTLKGLPDEGPFSAIINSDPTSPVSSLVVGQLRTGGVILTGSSSSNKMTKRKKLADGSLSSETFEIKRVNQPETRKKTGWKIKGLAR